MHKLDLFKYPLYPTEAVFSPENLTERVKSTLLEIKSFLPDLFATNAFEIQHTFSFDDDQMWLALAAIPSSQMNLPFNFINESLLQFKKRILEQISHLPQKVHYLLLDLETHSLFVEADQANLSPTEISFLQAVRSKRGDKLLFMFEGEQASFQSPDFNSTRIDPQTREIQCSINALFRFHAVIEKIQDPFAPSLAKSKKTRLIFGDTKLKFQNFDKISYCLKRGEKLKLGVKAVIDILTNNVIEYQLA